MGGDHGGFSSNERPVTTVTLTKSFWLGRTAVTQAQYEAVMGNNPSHFHGPDLPVESVSWNEAAEFCRRLTQQEQAAGRLPDDFAYTLPTEAQREYACRAGTTEENKENLNAISWHGSIFGCTHPVGQKQPNSWGFFDMQGNVYEWCKDWYGDYPGGSVIDPEGPSTGSSRVVRGGAWNCPATFCRATFRYRAEPGSSQLNIGFRVALSSVR
jgi:formylglycine-generating enzyme required for sulfatase activity